MVSINVVTKKAIRIIIYYNYWFEMFENLSWEIIVFGIAVIVAIWHQGSLVTININNSFNSSGTHDNIVTAEHANKSILKSKNTSAKVNEDENSDTDNDDSEDTDDEEGDDDNEDDEDGDDEDGDDNSCEDDDEDEDEDEDDDDNSCEDDDEDDDDNSCEDEDEDEDEDDDDDDEDDDSEWEDYDDDDEDDDDEDDDEDDAINHIIQEVNTIKNDIKKLSDLTAMVLEQVSQNSNGNNLLNALFSVNKNNECHDDICSGEDGHSNDENCTPVDTTNLPTEFQEEANELSNI
jgi:hypothetical protein